MEGGSKDKAGGAEGVVASVAPRAKEGEPPKVRVEQRREFSTLCTLFFIQVGSSKPYPGWGFCMVKYFAKICKVGQCVCVCVCVCM